MITRSSLLEKRGSCLGFSNNYRVGSLDRFRESVVEKFKIDIDYLMKQKHDKKREIKNLICKLIHSQHGMSDPKT